MTEVISAKQSYRVFIEAMDTIGYTFEAVSDEKGKFLHLTWADKEVQNPHAPKAWCTFTFIRRQSWLQVSLYFHVLRAPTFSGSERGYRDIMSYCSSYPDFKEDYPKSEAGVISATQECANWIGHFQHNVAQLSQVQPWTGEMLLLEKPIKNWVVMPGWQLWKD